MAERKQFTIAPELSDDMATYYANHVVVTGTANEVILTFSRVQIIPVDEDEPVVRTPIQAQVYIPPGVAHALEEALAQQRAQTETSLEGERAE